MAAMVKYFSCCRKQLMNIKATIMSKSKKILLSVIISMLVLFCASYWAVERFISTNISKTLIAQKLEEATGYHVVINGDLHWHYSLRPSLDLDKVTFFTTENKAAIFIKNPHISMALLPLLRKLVAVDFSFQELQQDQLHFSKGSSHLEYKDNQVNLTNFESVFYEGKIEGKAHIDLTNTTPKFNMTLSVSQTELGSLLKDIAQSVSVSGKMNANTTLTSEGVNAEQFIKNLNGQLSAQITNGKLHTIHLGKVIPDLPVEGADFFDTLNITTPIKDGIAITTISLLAKNYHAEGGGQINFNNQTLNIKLNAYYTRSQQTKNIAIPITLSEAIASPDISVDLGKPLTQLLSDNGIKLKNNISLLIKNL